MGSSEDSEDGEHLHFSSSGFSLQKLLVADKTPKKRHSKTSPPKIKKLKSVSSKKTAGKKRVSRKLNLGDFSGSHDCSEDRSNTYDNAGRGGGSSGKWLDKITPKKHWTCVQIADLGSVARTCEMCERERIRYVHTMSHIDYVEDLKVGCICAGHLSGDNGLSKERQAKLEQRLKRRENFPKLKNWKMSKNGRDYIVFQRKGRQYWVVITQPNGKYSAMIEDKSGAGEKEFINQFCKTKEQAQLAAFDHLFPPKLKFKENEQDEDFDFGYDEM